MFESVMNSEVPVTPKASPGALVVTGIASFVFTAILAGRMIWEETFLTLQEGPQMLGFTLAHGLGAILFLAPFLAFIYLIQSLWRKRSLSRWYWATLASSILVVGALSIPPAFFQWLMISDFASGPHAADLMTDAAAEGDLRTVRAYLDHGVPINAKNYEGSTSVYTAAAGGSLSVIELLASRGADLNATNSYGDSPLQAATDNRRADVVTFLVDHRGLLIRGTAEQRAAASKAIVVKAIEREKSWH